MTRYAIQQEDGRFTIGLLEELFPNVSGTPTDDWLTEQGALPVVDELPLDPTTEQVSVAPYLSDGKVYTVSAQPLPLDVVMAQQTSLINTAAQTALAALTASYPDLEIATWDQQLAEAQAFTADNGAPTPMLGAIGAACNTAVAALAAMVLTKADAYQKASGAIVGKRLALTSQIYMATTAAQVQLITW